MRTGRLPVAAVEVEEETMEDPKEEVLPFMLEILPTKLAGKI